MEQLENPNFEFPSSSTLTERSAEGLPQSRKQSVLKNLRGGFLIVLGYLLSPLCWWNDLVFNLPVAYGFGYLCSLISRDWLIPGAIAGYWLSNVVGILLMQAGAIEVFQGEARERNFKKELLSGVVTSTVYTFFILALVQFKVLDSLLPAELLSKLSSLIPVGIIGT
jgi:hypothetical protein